MSILLHSITKHCGLTVENNTTVSRFELNFFIPARNDFSCGRSMQKTVTLKFATFSFEVYMQMIIQNKFFGVKAGLH